MPYENVLVALDLAAENVEIVMRHAMETTADPKNITALHVLEQSYLYYGDDVAIAGAATIHEQTMQDLRVRMKALEGQYDLGKTAVLEGHPATEIHAYADEAGVDLIVLGTHGRHGWRLMMGSTANAVLHGTHCNVLAVRIADDG